MIKQKKIMPIFIPHAGCKHSCVFCNQRLICNTEKFTIEAVEQDIIMWLNRLKSNNHKSVELAFYGGSFTALEDDLQEKLLLLANKYDSVKAIRISTRPDCMTAKIAMKLYAYGVRTVEFGAQFLNDEQLLQAKRGHAVRDIYEAVETMRRYTPKMQVGLQLLMGFLGETREILRHTADEVVRIRPDIIRLYPLLVLKGTELADWYDGGLYIPLTLEEAVSRTAYLYEKFISAGINVIRVGLQASEELSDKDKMLAGPYHPAFGELVQSHLFFKKINIALDAMVLENNINLENKTVEIFCYDKDLSKIRGNNKDNVKYWQKKYGITDVICVSNASNVKWTLEIKVGKFVKKIKIL